MGIVGGDEALRRVGRGVKDFEVLSGKACLME